jgi:hypothetical protein
VIRLRYQFEGDDAIPKLFVSLAHVNRHVICLKATSQVEVYKNNQAKMAGAVFYPAGTVACFPTDTVIQPDNQVPISHVMIVAQHKAGIFAVLETLPTTFLNQLIAVVRASDTMEPRKKRRLAELLGFSL